MEKASILVTGGCGFIGSAFILRLFETLGSEINKINVINADCLTYAANPANLSKIEKHPNYVFINADIRDKSAVFGIFESYRVSRVVNLAAESHVDRSIEAPSLFAETNILGTLNLLEAARASWQAPGAPGGGKFLQVSTDEVYGSLPETGLFTESTPLCPRSPYSASKAAADMLALSFRETYGLPVVITRCGNNYGPRQYPEKLVPLMLSRALSGGVLPVYGDGQNIRDWIYVDDHARALYEVLTRGVPGEVYNVGSHGEMRNNEIVDILLDTLKGLLPENDPRSWLVQKARVEYVTDRLGHDRRYALDTSKIERELGWRPQTAFAEGIRQTVKWYLDNPEALEAAR